MKSRMNVTLDFLASFTKEVLTHLVKEAEKGDGDAGHCSCCNAVNRPHWSLRWMSLPSRGPLREAMCRALTVSQTV